MAGITSSSRSRSKTANAGAVANAFSPGFRRSSFCARPFGITTIIGTTLPSAIRLSNSAVRLGEALPLRLVAADAVQQVEDRVLRVGASSRAACRRSSCAACRPSSSRTRSSPACRAGSLSRRSKIAAGASGKAGTSSGCSTDGLRHPRPRRLRDCPGAGAGGAVGSWAALRQRPPTPAAHSANTTESSSSSRFPRSRDYAVTPTG